MKQLAALCTLLFVAAVAQAADQVPDSYAVVALIGDELSVVTYKPSIGSNLDRNDHRQVPIDEDRFDRLATQATGTVIQRAVPGSQTRLLMLSDHTAFAHSEEIATSQEQLKALLAPMSEQLRQSDAHYLVIISKYHSPARLKFVEGTTGSGKLSGLGFYLDYNRRVISSNNGNAGRGFIAPFAYLTATLVDLRTGAIVRSESTTTSAVIGTANSAAADVWDALTPQQKINAINAMIQRAIAEVVPRVVAPA
jgi:hypothetical protein